MWQANFIDHRWSCPRCGVRPTLYLVDNTSLCLNCKLRWQAARASAVAANETIEDFPFSAEELRRLAVYRRAVDAGFFSDDPTQLIPPRQS